MKNNVLQDKTCGFHRISVAGEVKCGFHRKLIIEERLIDIINHNQE